MPLALVVLKQALTLSAESACRLAVKRLDTLIF